MAETNVLLNRPGRFPHSRVQIPLPPPYLVANLDEAAGLFLLFRVCVRHRNLGTAPGQFPSLNGHPSLTERTSSGPVRFRAHQRFQKVPRSAWAHILQPFSRLASASREREVGVLWRSAPQPQVIDEVVMRREASGSVGGSQSSNCLSDDADVLPSCASIAHFGENARKNDGALEQGQAVYHRATGKSSGGRRYR